MEHIEEREPPTVITSDTDNATTIQPEEAAPDRQYKFRKFRAYNTGLWNGPRRENKEAIRRQDDLHRYDSIASTLHLTSYQKSRGRKVLEDFDCHTFGDSIDHIIFGICVVIVNNAVEDGVRYWPSAEPDDDSIFSKFAESLGFDWKEQMSSIKKVQARVDL